MKKQNTWLVGLVVIAVGASVCRILLWGSILQVWTEGGVPVSDARALDMWALNILDGLGFKDVMGYWVYHAFRMPFFSIVLAALYGIFGYVYFPVRLVLASVSVATCLEIAGIGRLLFNRKVGLVAGFFYAFYYPMVQYSIAHMTETLFTFLFVSGVYLFLRSVHERSWGFVLGSGIALGLAGMTRFVVFVTVPVMGIYLLTDSISWTRKLRFGAIWIVAMILSFSPWVIRNAFVFHAFFPSESGGTRQLWTAANPSYTGLHFNIEAWRELLWVDPDASEIERNQRLQRETKQFIRENFIWYVDRMVGRARYYLALPTWKDVKNQRDVYSLWLMASTWFAAHFGYLGFALAIGKRIRAGLFLAGVFFSLSSLHALAGELTRYRLTSEWLWVIGAAYTLFCISRLSTRAIFRLDEENDQPIRTSMFDRRMFRWIISLIVLFPFVVIAVRIPLNRSRLRRQELPPLPYSVTEIVKQAGLEEQFKAQGSVLHDIAYYKHIAQQQYTEQHRYAENVTFPDHVVLHRGEISHVIFDPERRIQSFSFRINKVGLYIGDAVVYYTIREDIPLVLPKALKRSQGLVVGTISGSGTRGEPVILVADLYVYDHGNWFRCRQ